MSLLQRWQSRTALTLAVAMAATGISTVAAPFSVAKAASAESSTSSSTAEPLTIAQRFPDSWRSALPSGTFIPIRYDKEKIVLTPDETVPVTFVVAQDVTNSRGNVVIPEGSEIEGELQPSGNGTRFIAQSITLDNEDDSDAIEASSQVVDDREVINERSDPDLLKGAAIGAAAGAVLGEIFGRIDLWEVLGGAGVGALGSVIFRDRDEVEVISVNPDELDIRLDAEYVPSQRTTLR